MTHEIDVMRLAVAGQDDLLTEKLRVLDDDLLERLHQAGRDIAEAVEAEWWERPRRARR